MWNIYFTAKIGMAAKIQQIMYIQIKQYLRGKYEILGDARWVMLGLNQTC